MADAQDPLCAWSAVERAFLEEGGDGAVDAARAGRARPDVSVSRCRDAYLEIGATNEVRLIDKCARPGAEGLMIGFAHPKATGGVLTEFCCPK